MCIQYSKSIANAVFEYLSKDEWSFSFNSDAGFFGFKYKLRDMPDKLELLLTVHDGYYIVYGLCPIKADTRKVKNMHQISKFLHRVNWALKCGSWSIDLDTGHINFKVCTDCAGLEAPSGDMICSNICCVIAMFERYGSGISDILSGNADITTALEACENKELKFDDIKDF